MKNILWGTLLFGILLIGHQEETNRILSSLHTFEFPFTSVQENILSGVMLLFSLVWSIVERKASFLLTVCMLFVGWYLPLLSAFSLYFICQHSLNGWRHLKIGLNTTSQTLYLKSLPFNLGAIGLLVISYWLVEKNFMLKNNAEMASIFFIFLSSISFPHILWMHNFYKKKNC
jgi:Brp/Blh family beta-carotene 15,15'-monooxygenase